MITDTSFNIELLYVLVAVNDAHSINKSSDTLRMTQPAISKKIKQLETYYGKQLFLRSAQGMTLTSAGQNLYLETKKLIQQFENMHALMTESQVSLADLKLGSLDSIASNMYPNFFSHYLSDLKEVTLTNKIYELITPFNSGQLDAILIDHEFSKEVTGQFEDIQLFEEPYYLVYSQKNKDLVTLNRPTLDATDLNYLKLLMYPKYCPIHQRISQIYQINNKSLPDMVEIDYSESTIAMVANSDYVTILPKSVAVNKVTQDPTRLAMKQLAEPFTRTVSLFTRDKATRQLIHEMLIKS